MLRDVGRLCDVCGYNILKGEKYIVSKVPKTNAQTILEMTQANPETAPTTTVDSEGNLRLDICLDCHMHMHLPGTSAVN